MIKYENRDKDMCSKYIFCIGCHSIDVYVNGKIDITKSSQLRGSVLGEQQTLFLMSFNPERSMNDSNNNLSPEKKVYACPDRPYKTYKSRHELG